MKTIAAGSFLLVAASIWAPAPAAGAADAWSAPPAVPPALAVPAAGNGAAAPPRAATATAQPANALLQARGRNFLDRAVLPRLQHQIQHHQRVACADQQQNLSSTAWLALSIQPVISPMKR